MFAKSYGTISRFIIFYLRVQHWLWLGLGLFLGGCISSGDEEGTRAPLTATSRPYQIKGEWYYPQQHYELCETGIASWYGGPDGCHGGPTATGERFDMYGLTAAHKTLPLPCVVWVENLRNGRGLKLMVNDRGPFKPHRILDVSVRAAQLLGFYEQGTTPIRLTTLVQESKQVVQHPQYRQAFRSSPVAKPSVTTASSEWGIEQQIDAWCQKLPTKTPKVPVIAKQAYLEICHTSTLGEAMVIAKNFASLGQSRIQKFFLGGCPVYRVFVGPLPELEKAKQGLDQAVTLGYPNAHIVME